ncbi:MAG: glycosyltransferase [Bacteroidota bacterium]
MKIEQNQQKRVLISPLNWGLGHASRLIPVITELDKLGHKVIIAAEGTALQLLQKEFPGFYFFNLKGYKIRYSRVIPLALKIFLLTPRILFGIRKEHYVLKQLINEFMIDIVISDNRFGMWSKKAYSVYITHQIKIKTPKVLVFLRPFLSLMNRYYIKKYNECWIPDYYTDPSLAGDLSHPAKLPQNTKYVGLLSRFTMTSINKIEFPAYDILIILSGPEPQRSIFERKICKQLKNITHKVLLVRGMPNKKFIKSNAMVDVKDHLNANEMKSAILNAKYIISRAGFSTIMDLIALKRNAILIPTPGQTEQEYLAEYYHEKSVFYSVKQKKFNLETALKKSASCVKIIDIPEINYDYLTFNNLFNNSNNEGTGID